MNISEILLTRALNAMRTTYFPSYVGLRLIGNQLGPSNKDLLERIILRRLSAADPWRFKRFKMYKASITVQGETSHEYRNCLASSPITSIAESLVLGLMAADPAFSVHPRVFSYRWPKSILSGVSYEFFGNGYQARNSEIAEKLDVGKVAVVTDIKAYYPSVSREKIMHALQQRLARAQPNLTKFREEIVNFYTQLLNSGEGGIPIGPAAGHLLGHLALDEFDAELTGIYGDNYFRYVDDIIVITDSHQADIVRSTIEKCLRRHGFTPNTDKSTFLTPAEWHESITKSDVASDDSFRGLASDLSVYLAFHANKADELRKLFHDNGLPIPIRRLLSLSRYSRFRYFIRRIRSISSFRRTARIYASSPALFLVRAQALKGAYEGELGSLLAQKAESDISKRRWQIQRIRRVVNSLFYLRDFNEWEKGIADLESTPELIEQRSLGRALASGNPEGILPFFGRGSSAFSELWREYRGGRIPLSWPEAGYTDAELESIASLQFSGVVDLSMEAANNQQPLTRILAIAQRNRPTGRTETDFSFEDELESLRLSVDNEEISELANTRYSLQEGTSLEALSLLSSEYRS
ncbi:RNA-directed DNA polymerase [Cupriavidus necator]|uniref:RNA-directed DNA polymerase n=1 Tax=Cupriavidus necator TaxID=106590 RepID=UPI0039C226AF